MWIGESLFNHPQYHALLGIGSMKHRHNFLPDCLRFGLPLTLFVLIAASSQAQSSAPLHERIDQAIEAEMKDFDSQAAPLASDEEFLRRIYLDLAGKIPTVKQAKDFLNDKSPNKRAKLIDQLLESPDFSRHMVNVFDVMLMERRPDKYVKRGNWRQFLRASFDANKPYDQLVREILSADGTETKPDAAKFYLDRIGEPNLVTKDVGRLFLGMNLQCAQCHDHPLVNAYKQDFYYGINAFYNRSYLFTDKKKKRTFLAEKAVGEVSFSSVFVPKVT